MSADHPTRPPPARRRTWLRVGIVLVLIFLGVAAIAAVRYAPLLDQARLARETARSLSAHAGSLDPADLDTASLASLRAELDSLASLLAPFRDLVSCDPLVGIARDLPRMNRRTEVIREWAARDPAAAARAVAAAELPARERERLLALISGSGWRR